MYIFYKKKDREMQNFGSWTAILGATTDWSLFSRRILLINDTLLLFSEKEFNEYHI